MDLYKIREKLCMGIPLKDIKLRVTNYSRVSTEHLEQQTSLKNQIEQFDEMIKSNPNWIYIPGYVDDGKSGTSDIKRDNFMKMINDAKNDKFDLIITKEISRFSRNTLDSIKYTRELLNSGVAVLFMNDNINTALPDSELRLTIMASMAQDEIRRLSERVKFGMHASIKKGKILGNNKLYGYIKNKDGKLKILEYEAEIVKRIFTYYGVEHKTLNNIAKILNSENIPTSQNKKWTITTIKRLIENPKYKGFYCGKKSEVVDYITKKVKKNSKEEWIVFKSSQIKPIVSEELWELANKRLISRKNNDVYKNRYPLSAKIICKKHNCLFHRRKQCKNDITWMCSKYLNNGKKSCDTANIRESEIYSIIKDILKLLNINTNKIKELLLTSYFKDGFSNNIKPKVSEKIISKKNKLLKLYLEDLITKKELKEQLNNLEKVANTSINIIDSKKEKIICDFIEEYLNSNQIIDNILNIYLDKIIVSKVSDEEIILEIHFKKNNRKISKTYTFYRGYNHIGTKRYSVKYNVFIF